MLVLVAYDIHVQSANGKKRLLKTAKLCENYGIRVQNSLFECIIDAQQLRTLKQELTTIIHPKYDQVRFYRLGNRYHTKIDFIGKDTRFDIEAPLIF